MDAGPLVEALLTMVMGQKRGEGELCDVAAGEVVMR